jgi:hypothetical protein
MSLAQHLWSDKHRRAAAMPKEPCGEILYNNFHPRDANAFGVRPTPNKSSPAKGKFDVPSENSPSRRSPGN